MKLKIYIKYFLFLYILAISSFEYFHRVTQPALYLLFPIATACFFFFRKSYDKKFIYIILPFFTVFILQTVLYGTPIYFALTFVIRMITIYFVVKIIGLDLVKIFVNSIKVIATVSLFFYILQYNKSIYNLLINFCSDFTNLGSNPEVVVDWPNFIIYTIQPNKLENSILFRNSGPFWEPGLYCIFLNIALFLNLFTTKRILNKNNILLIISIISAFSTTGIIVLLMNLTFFVLSNKSLKLQYRVVLIAFFVSIIPILISLPFMGDKIQNQMNQSDLSYSRFGAAVVHWNIIKDYPVAGLPNDLNKTYGKYADNISPNGITEIFVRYGIIVGLLYFIFLFKSCFKMMQYINRKAGILLFIIMVTSIFSENMGTRPIYLLFICLSVLSEYDGHKYKVNFIKSKNDKIIC